ncbi:hypothetical protein X757_22920 [Mesorhizobium sp. LSHC414A00]|nr:hypothetical protein X757_22920 [Mesorhizobium sp. LSHC414A00]
MAECFSESRLENTLRWHLYRVGDYAEVGAAGVTLDA